MITGCGEASSTTGLRFDAMVGIWLFQGFHGSGRVGLGWVGVGKGEPIPSGSD